MLLRSPSRRGPAQAQARELRAAAEELLVHAREARAAAAVEEVQLAALRRDVRQAFQPGEVEAEAMYDFYTKIAPL